MTAAAFDSFIPGARYVLAIAVMLFAYSTMISWSYYGERAWEYLFGIKSILAYRIIFCMFCVYRVCYGITECARFFRCDDPGHGVPEYCWRHYLKSTDQGRAQRILGALQGG